MKQKAEFRRQKFHLLTSEFWLLASIPLTFAAFTVKAHAQNEDPWLLCSDLRLVTNPAIKGDGTGLTFADADSVESLDKNISRLSGNVSILQGSEELFADQALFDRSQQRFELTGNVGYRSPEMELAGAHMLAYGNSDILEISDARFYFPAQHAGGYAHQIAHGTDNITVLDKASYTTCDPADPDWEFRARRITLDHTQGQGYARSMSVRFKNMPIFYFPILSFPIDDRRKSGFLLPSIGDSDKHGFELAVPYYWNIAPQADATLTPQQMARRGIKLDSEWRYLNRWSTNELRLEYLDDELFGEPRDLDNLRHNGAFGNGWHTMINYTKVSDNDYFDDFGSNLSGSSLTHLKQELLVKRIGPHWEFSARTLDFQTIDETIPAVDHPYRLEPSLQLQGNYPQLGEYVDFSLTGSLVEFEHDLRTTGQRFDMRPRIAFPFGSGGWYLTPALSARHTAYRLDDTALPADNREINRSVPTFSLDSGLIFERSLGGLESGLLQTLEPRMFLLKTPFREQADIPVFDTGLPDFSFAQLFSENRFVGADRVGDAEQAAIALSTGIMRRNNGDEILRAGIGRVFYNAERRVTLPGQPPETEDVSGLLAEIKAALSSYWSTSLAVEWNSERDTADKELFRLRYQGDNRHIFNLAYRSRAAEDLEQGDLSFSWPLSDRWSAIGRWNRSLNDDIDLEQFAGLQYESCCYAVRIVAREYLTEDQMQNSAIFFQLSLKGLTKIGDNTDELLERGILGYKNSY
ncbi:MAG TPA: LPS assembly protein LptD [Gammaproteobacteria bacterium]